MCIDIADPHSAISYWPKMSPEYVLAADPNSAVSYWPKMLQYVTTIKLQTRNKPIVTGLKCYSMYIDSGSKFGR